MFWVRTDKCALDRHKGISYKTTGEKKSEQAKTHVLLVDHELHGNFI